MSTWSPAEFAALFQAWQEAIDTPLRERSKISHEVFRRFTVILGGATTRSEGSVSFKQGSLKNMTQLVMAFGDRDAWFAFSAEQKKQWFKMVNRKSYKFIDLDRPTFHAVARLIQRQAMSTNMRVTSAQAVHVDTSVRVSLRRQTADSEWQVMGQSADGGALPSSSTLADSVRGTVSNRLHSDDNAPRKREFPFAAPPKRDVRALFAPVTTDARSIFAPPASASAMPAAAASGRRNDVVLFGAGDSDSSSDSSDSDSDSDIDLMAESEAVAARLKLLEAQSIPGAAMEMTGSIDTGSNALPVMPTQSPFAPTLDLQQTQPHEATAHALAASRPRPLSPKRSPSSVSSNSVAPLTDLPAATRLLETQAQALAALFADVKASAAEPVEVNSSMSSTVASAGHAPWTAVRETQAIIDALKLDAQLTESERAQRHELAAERRDVLQALERVRDQRQQWLNTQQADEQARQQLLEMIETDRLERRAFAAAHLREQLERDAFRVLLEQDRTERQHAREQREALTKRVEALEAALYKRGYPVDEVESVADQENQAPHDDRSSSSHSAGRLAEGDAPRFESANNGICDVMPKSKRMDTEGGTSNAARSVWRGRPVDDGKTRLQLR